MASRKTVNSHALEKSMFQLKLEQQEKNIESLERGKSPSKSSNVSLTGYESCEAFDECAVSVASDDDDCTIYLGKTRSERLTDLERPYENRFVGLGRPSVAQVDNLRYSDFGRPKSDRRVGLGQPGAAQFGNAQNGYFGRFSGEQDYEQNTRYVGGDILGRPSVDRFVGLGRPSAAQIEKNPASILRTVSGGGFEQPRDERIFGQYSSDIKYSGLERPSEKQFLGFGGRSNEYKQQETVPKIGFMRDSEQPKNEISASKFNCEQNYDHFYRTPTNHLRNSTKAKVGDFDNYRHEDNIRQGETTSRGKIETEILRDAFVSVLKEVTERKDETTQFQKLIARQTMGGELTTFDGSPKEWLAFASRFKRTTEQCDYNDEENMSRLRKCLKGRAREAVRMILENSCNVAAAMEILEVNFGRPDMIIGDLIEEAKRAPTVHAWSDFVQFSNIVLNLEATISNLNESVYIMNPLLLREFVAKLPPYIELKWAEFLMDKGIRSPNLQHFSEWVRKSAATITYAGLVDHSPQSSTQLQEPQSQLASKSSNQHSTTNNKTCKVCKGAHSADVCKHFQQMPVKQRWREAERSRLCFGCLGNHSKNNCNNLRACGVNECQKTHHRLLHQDVSQTQPQQQATLIHTNKSSVPCRAVLLRIVPVIVQGPKGKLSTFALLDDASTVTMVDSSVAEQIGVEGPVSNLCCVWTKGKTQTEENSKKVSIEVKIPNNGKRFTLNNVRTITDLALPELSLDTEELKAAYPFVGDHIWRTIRKAKPTILIGQDHADLTVPRSVIQPNREGVILSKCRLGWTVHGPILTRSIVPKAEIINFCCERAAEDENLGVALITEEKQRTNKDCRWLKGPDLLYTDETQWPENIVHNEATEGIVEEEWVNTTVALTSALPDEHRFSSWTRLVRATVWCLRFVRNCRIDPEQRRKAALTVEEIGQAERQWWLRVQTESFGGDRKSTKSGEKVSYRLNDLSPKKDELVKDMIEWHFIPPAAPHMGGAWKRMIGSVKRALLTVMKHRKLTDEVLLTVFAEVENIIKNRPLTHVSDDPCDPMGLTPNNFLIGAANISLAPGAFDDSESDWRRRWKVAQSLTDKFWKRWLRQYVPMLVNRSKWLKPEQNLSVGHLVVIDDPGLPRNLWPIGVISGVWPGDDDVVRAVDVRTVRGTLRRPAQKVCLYDRVGEEEPTLGGECEGVNDPSDDEAEFHGFDIQH